MPAKKKVKVLYNNYISQTCGVGVLGYFRFDGEPGTAWADDIEDVIHHGGCGWVIASFTPNKAVYEEAFKQMVKRFGDPVYTSPVRINTRTKNKFFFCIFDGKGK